MDLRDGCVHYGIVTHHAFAGARYCGSTGMACFRRTVVDRGMYLLGCYGGDFADKTEDGVVASIHAVNWSVGVSGNILARVGRSLNAKGPCANNG
jgi:hypothetical protein